MWNLRLIRGWVRCVLFTLPAHSAGQVSKFPSSFWVTWNTTNIDWGRESISSVDFNLQLSALSSAAAASPCRRNRPSPTAVIFLYICVCEGVCVRVCLCVFFKAHKGLETWGVCCCCFWGSCCSNRAAASSLWSTESGRTRRWVRSFDDRLFRPTVKWHQDWSDWLISVH